MTDRLSDPDVLVVHARRRGLRLDLRRGRRRWPASDPGTVLERVHRGLLRRPGAHAPTDLVSEVCEFPFLNPQTGPFYVEGAEPGDTLAVHFVSIEPARDWAASHDRAAVRGADLDAPDRHPAAPAAGAGVDLAARPRRARPAGSRADDSDYTVDLPMDPMHGTVGVAPANLEVRSALVPDALGGNMDTPEMRAGVTCYLGVNVEGALCQPRRRPRPPGRGRDVRRGGRDGDEHAWSSST